SGDAIAAGATFAAGDGNVALQLAGLGQVSMAALGGSTLGGFYVDLAAGVGTKVQNASRDSDTEQTLLDQVDQQRSSVSGVSVDEEMSLLIGQQQAYTAAAHLIKVAQDMMDDVLNMI